MARQPPLGPFWRWPGAGMAFFGPVAAAVILSSILTLAPLTTINYQVVACRRGILLKQPTAAQHEPTTEKPYHPKTHQRPNHGHTPERTSPRVTGGDRLGEGRRR